MTGMPMNNAGLRRLVALVDRLTTADMKGLCPAFDLWHDRRWKVIEESLDLWCRDPAMNRFIDKYADSLADDLGALFARSDITLLAAVDVAMDIMEELFAQAKAVHMTVQTSEAPT